MPETIHAEQSMTCHGPSPEGVTDHEREAAEGAWTELRRAAGFTSGRLALTAHRVARELFTLGWAACARGGAAAPAMADVPLSAEETAEPLRALLVVTDAPRVGQRVSYHGSHEELHGYYWVTKVTESLADGGGALARQYELSEWTGSRYRRVVWRVRARSITGLPEFRYVLRPTP